MGLVGCYTVHLYCDSDEEHRFPDCDFREFAGHNEMECVREARACGWRVSFSRHFNSKNGIGRCFCPIHSGKKKST
jgi:hypothetical protein